MKYLKKIIHINCSPELLKDKEALKALNKLVKLAYHKKIKKK